MGEYDLIREPDHIARVWKEVESALPMLEIGAAGRLLVSGELEEVLPLDDAELLDAAGPVGSDSRLRLSEDQRPGVGLAMGECSSADSDSRATAERQQSECSRASHLLLFCALPRFPGFLVPVQLSG